MRLYTRRLNLFSKLLQVCTRLHAGFTLAATSVALAAALLLAFVGCNTGGYTTDAMQDGITTYVESILPDEGEGVDRHVVDVKIHNSDSSPMILKLNETSCGCLGVSYGIDSIPLEQGLHIEVPPNGQVPITVAFRPSATVGVKQLSVIFELQKFGQSPTQYPVTIFSQTFSHNVSVPAALVFNSGGVLKQKERILVQHARCSNTEQADPVVSRTPFFLDTINDIKLVKVEVKNTVTIDTYEIPIALNGSPSKKNAYYDNLELSFNDKSKLRIPVASRKPETIQVIPKALVILSQGKRLSPVRKFIVKSGDGSKFSIRSVRGIEGVLEVKCVTSSPASLFHFELTQIASTPTPISGDIFIQTDRTEHEKYSIPVSIMHYE
jgi:hypothetical protein